MSEYISYKQMDDFFASHGGAEKILPMLKAFFKEATGVEATAYGFEMPDRSASAPGVFYLRFGVSPTDHAVASESFNASSLPEKLKSMVGADVNIRVEPVTPVWIYSLKAA